MWPGSGGDGRWWWWKRDETALGFGTSRVNSPLSCCLLPSFAFLCGHSWNPSERTSVVVVVVPCRPFSLSPSVWIPPHSRFWISWKQSTNGRCELVWILARERQGRRREERDSYIQRMAERMADWLVLCMALICCCCCIWSRRIQFFSTRWRWLSLV